LIGLPRTSSWQSQLALSTGGCQLCGALVTTAALRFPLALVVIFSLAHSYSELDSGPTSRVKESCQLCCERLRDLCDWRRRSFRRMYLATLYRRAARRARYLAANRATPGRSGDYGDVVQSSGIHTRRTPQGRQLPFSEFEGSNWRKWRTFLCISRAGPTRHSVGSPSTLAARLLGETVQLGEIRQSLRMFQGQDRACRRDVTSRQQLWSR
jgi:hypothetical protein